MSHADARARRARGLASQRRSGNAIFIAAATLAQATVVCAGTVLHVDDDAPAGGDGSTWPSAYRFLQDALTAAQPGSGVTEIRVGQGVYAPDRGAASPAGTGDRAATFALIDGVALRGGFAGTGEKDPDARDVTLHATVLTGDLLGDDEDGGDHSENAHHVVTGSGTTAAAILEGFTITRGNTTGSSVADGAGLLVLAGGPVILDCVFEGNAAPTATGSGAGAMSNSGSPRFERCVFANNAATAESVASAGGGAFYCFGGSATLADCVFIANSSTRGGALYVAGDVTVEGGLFDGNVAANGGAIFRRELSGLSNRLTVTRSRFIDNVGTTQGGAVSLEGGDVPPRFFNCEFIENRADFGNGGAIRSGAAGATIANCLLAGNTAGAGGGGVATMGGVDDLVNCTLVSNWASFRGGGVYVTGLGDAPRITNTMLWDNASPAGAGEVGQIDRPSNTSPLPVVRYCLVAGLTGALGGAGNIDADPGFVSPAGDDGDPETHSDNDYRLAAGSPAADAGHNWGALPDHADLDGDGNTKECMSLDLDDAPRFADAPLAPDDGCGTPVVVEIGAYERAGVSADPVIPGDATGDGEVGFFDLLEVLTTWGARDGVALADFDLDGTVGTGDLILLLYNWT